jgi:hypothetical protein
LLPYAIQDVVLFLVGYFKPRSLICYNPYREALDEIDFDCYKLPANFLNSKSRLSLIKGAVDLAVLHNLPPEYWYIAYDYVIRGGCLVGDVANIDERFIRWGDVVGYNQGVIVR